MLMFTHTAAYFALSAAYAGSCIGLDKTAVSAATAFLYLLLAIDAYRHK